MTDQGERPATTSPTDPPAARRPRVFLVGYYGMDNLGDEAIRGEIERVAGRLGVDVWRVATRRPRRDARAVWLTARGIPHYMGAIIGADRVVIGGGGILKDEGLRLPLDLAVTCLVARLTRTPVTLVGVGVGPFYTRLGRWLIRRVAGTARYRSVRDDASAALLASLGIDAIEVGADPVFAAEPRGAASPDAGAATDAIDRPAASELARDPARPRTMLVSVRSWFLKDPDGGAARQAALFDAIAAAIAPHAESGWQIELVPLYFPRDVAVARELADRLPRAAAVTVVDTALDWETLLERLTTVDLVVTMRFHALAAALIGDRPAVAIAYEPKVAELAARTATPVVLVDDPAFLASFRGALAAASEPASPIVAARRRTAVGELHAAAERIVGRALTDRFERHAATDRESRG